METGPAGVHPPARAGRRFRPPPERAAGLPGAVVRRRAARASRTADAFSYFIGRKYERRKKPAHRPPEGEKGDQNDHLKTSDAVAAEPIGLFRDLKMRSPKPPKPWPLSMAFLALPSSAPGSSRATSHRGTCASAVLSPPLSACPAA